VPELCGVDISIRKARSHDTEGILECLKQAFAPYQSGYTPDAFSDTVLSQETIGQRLAEMTVLVAVNDAGRVIGTIAYKVRRDGVAHLRGMAVRPEWQEHGAANKLLAEVEGHLRDLQCRTLTLDTTRPLERAIRFYEDQGFWKTGDRRDVSGFV
jgi:N-acetylglutamate synthase-like GNAT family acetyltransferase